LNTEAAENIRALDFQVNIISVPMIKGNYEFAGCVCGWLSKNYIKRSKRSLFTLQIGHISGGFSRAHRYPQTLHRHTGKDSVLGKLLSGFAVIFNRSSLEGRLSGIVWMFCFLAATAALTYSPQKHVPCSIKSGSL
jgi:hypothetical protein